ncbi:MAG: hypothetical protein ACK4ZW_12085 [Blastomonas sp.]
MKKSDEWADQNTVDEKCRQTMAERGCTPEQVRPVWIAEKLGMSKPGGHLYGQVRDWRRRECRPDPTLFAELPADAARDIRSITNDLADGLVTVAKRIMRDQSAIIEQAASRKIADAERRQAEAEAELADVAAEWQETEDALAASQKKVAALTEELAQSDKRAERLRGRIEQLKEELGHKGPMTEHATPVAANPVQSLRSESPVGHQEAVVTRPTGAPASAPTPPPTASHADGEALAKPDNEGPIR